MTERSFSTKGAGRSAIADAAASASAVEEEAPKRAAIRAAAIELFTRHGFGATTVRSIAEEADISVGLVYMYFESKEAILVDACSSVARAMVMSSKPPADRDADVLSRLEATWIEVVRTVDEWSDLHLLVYRESPVLPRESLEYITDAEQAVVKVFQDFIDEGIAVGVFRAHDSELTARTFLMVAHMWALKRWRLRELYDPLSYSQMQLENLLGGICLRGADGSQSLNSGSQTGSGAKQVASLRVSQGKGS